MRVAVRVILVQGRRSMAGIIERLDAQLDELFRGWNWLTIVILTLLLIFLIYPLVTARDPDTHPLLLSRQANVSPVRQPGESAIHRALETPHGCPLKAGLGVRNAGTPKYAAGKDGDLRHIWQRAVQGEPDSDDRPTGNPGKILTVRGVEQVKEHDLAEITKEIHIVGQFVKQKGASYVAVYLPNSTELLTVLFGEYSLRGLLILQHIAKPDSRRFLWFYANPDPLRQAKGCYSTAPEDIGCGPVDRGSWLITLEGRP